MIHGNLPDHLHYQIGIISRISQPEEETVDRMLSHSSGDQYYQNHKQTPMSQKEMDQMMQLTSWLLILTALLQETQEHY